jgi:CHAT domain
MDDDILAGLRERAEVLVPYAATLVQRSPHSAPLPPGVAPPDNAPEALDRTLAELAMLESAVGAAPGVADEADEEWIWSVQIALGSLYATRYFRNRGAQDRAEGLRLLRPARAAGRLRTRDDPNLALLLAVLLLPALALNGFDGTIGNLYQIMDLGKAMMQGGSGGADAVEAFVLVQEVAACPLGAPGASGASGQAGGRPPARLPVALTKAADMIVAASQGGTVPKSQVANALDAMSAATGPGVLSDMINSLRVIISQIEQTPPEPVAPPQLGQGVQDEDSQDEGNQDEDSRDEDSQDEYNMVVALLALCAPILGTRAELPELIDRLESTDGPRSPQDLLFAAFTRVVQGLRTGRGEWIDSGARQFRELLDGGLPDGLAVLARSMFPALLVATSLTGGNLRDAARALDLLDPAGETLPPGGALPVEPAAYDALLLGRAFLRIWLRAGAAGADGDVGTLEELHGELLELERTANPDSGWYALVPYSMAWVELKLAATGDGVNLLRAAIQHLDAARNTPTVLPLLRPLLESTAPVTLALTLLVEPGPQDLAQAVARTRRALDEAPNWLDQSADLRMHIALAFKMQHLQTGERGPLLEALQELEAAADGLDEDNSTTANYLYWELADVYHRRGDPETDDLGRAIARALQSLRVVAVDVLLQLGAEHGLRAARSGASHGLTAAGWAAAGGRVEQAVTCLEVGRALVLRAAAAASRIPQLLEAAEEGALAERWRREVEAAGREGSGGGSPLSAAVAALDPTAPAHVPSELRRAALAALQGTGGTDAVQELLAVPSLDELRSAVAEAGLDALVYLIPGDGDAPGTALIVGPDDRAQALPLPGLADFGRAQFDAYLDACATRSALGSRDIDAVAEATRSWETALEELCDWAGPAVMDEILGVLPATPTVRRPARLVVVPCGNLGVVPWHAARLSRPPAEVGLDRPVRACDLAVLSYAPSGREFLRALSRPRAPLAERPVLLADPSRTLSWAPAEVALVRDVFLPGALLLGHLPDAGDHPAGSPEEVVDLLTGTQGPPASLLHIAAHGRVGTRPTLSALLLAAPAEAPRAAGGRHPGADLTVTRILDSTAQGVPGDLGSLVVLSACQTDLSDRDFDEALTLATAFTARGAADTVGSRWQVSDEATAVLMAVFHRWLAEGLAPADALRSAQRWMLDESREVFRELTTGRWPVALASPLHATSAWAAFTHQGNVRPAPEQAHG